MHIVVILYRLHCFSLLMEVSHEAVSKPNKSRCFVVICKACYLSEEEIRLALYNLFLTKSNCLLFTMLLSNS